MAVGRYAASSSVVAAVRPGMPVGFARIFSVCHVVRLCGRWIPLPRPQNNAVRGHIRKIANKFEICRFKAAAGAQISARTNPFDWFRSIQGRWQLGVQVGLLQHGAPELALRREDRFMRPDRLRHELGPSVAHLFVVNPVAHPFRGEGVLAQRSSG